jgi:hypothetical protein
MKLINDGRTLRAMSKAGHFKYPVDKGHKYVDEEKNPSNFEYRGQRYKIKYLDGCFYPFVFLNFQDSPV